MEIVQEKNGQKRYHQVGDQDLEEILGRSQHVFATIVKKAGKNKDFSFLGNLQGKFISESLDMLGRAFFLIDFSIMIGVGLGLTASHFFKLSLDRIPRIF